MPSPRATIETWPVGAPSPSAIPATSPGRSVATADGSRSWATRIAGRPSACHRSDPPCPLRIDGDAPADVAHVGRPGPEILVVDARQHGRLVVGAGEDGVDRPGAVVDGAHRRVDDARVAREQRLGLEDRAGLVPCPFGELARQRLEVGGRRLEGGLEARTLLLGEPTGPARRRCSSTGATRRTRPDAGARRADPPGQCDARHDHRSTDPSARRDDVGERAQEQRGGRRARVLMTDAPLPEIRRAALGREHRDRRGRAGLGRVGHGPDDGRDVAAGVTRVPTRVERRDEGVEHRLLAGRRLAEPGDAADGRLEGGQQDVPGREVRIARQ